MPEVHCICQLDLEVSKLGLAPLSFLVKSNPEISK